MEVAIPPSRCPLSLSLPSLGYLKKACGSSWIGSRGHCCWLWCYSYRLEFPKFRHLKAILGVDI